MNTKATVTMAVATLLFFSIIIFAFWDIIAQVIFLGSAIIVSLTILFGIILWIIRIYKEMEEAYIIHLDRKEKQKNSEVTIVTTQNGQVHIKDTSGDSDKWRAAHLDYRIHTGEDLENPNPQSVSSWQMYNSPKTIPAPSSQSPLLLPAQIDILSALDSVQRCLIVGASDSGKTTLLQHLVARRLHTSNVIVIDPHAYPNKWASDCAVVGLGRDYEKIEGALDALVRLMTKRYDEIGKGTVVEMGHEKVTILIDEWRAITSNVKSAADAIKALLTESRKAAFSVFVASHSDRAKPLGLEGEYDLKDGFAIVRLSLFNGMRSATIDTGDGPIPARLPGEFGGNGYVAPIRPDLVIPTRITEREQRIMALYQAGWEAKDIAKEIYPTSRGGNQIRLVEDAINRLAALHIKP